MDLPIRLAAPVMRATLLMFTGETPVFDITALDHEAIILV
jgi:hypothetical protein